MTNPVVPPPTGAGPHHPTEAFGPADAEAPRKGRGAAKWVVGIAVALILGIGWFGVQSYLNRDLTADAKIGDCIATGTVVADQEKEADPTMAECGTPDAAYSVVGRVENDTDLESRACDRYFTEEKAEYAIVASVDGDGYLLCLKKV